MRTQTSLKNRGSNCKCVRKVVSEVMYMVENPDPISLSKGLTFLPFLGRKFNEGFRNSSMQGPHKILKICW
jgi:hypothetical protein